MASPAANRGERPGLALVTGGCSGIGLAIAHQLAARGHRLILVSNRAEELTLAAAEIAARHGTFVHPVVLDLARAEAAAELYAAAQALSADVEILVSNAGFFFFGEVVDAAPLRAQAMLQLHVVTPSLLCTLFGKEMRTRGRGRILLVSSLSAWRDFPGIAYYGASKKYLRGFACSLRSELSIYGVSVTCLAPGATATGLYDRTNVPVERARRLGVMMTPEAVAAAAVRAMFAGRALCMPGLLTRLMAFAAILTPQWVVDLIRRRAPWLPMQARESADPEP